MVTSRNPFLLSVYLDLVIACFFTQIRDDGKRCYFACHQYICSLSLSHRRYKVLQKRLCKYNVYIYIFNSTKAFFKAHDPRERKIYNKQTKKMCVNVAMNRVI